MKLHAILKQLLYIALNGIITVFGAIISLNTVLFPAEYADEKYIIYVLMFIDFFARLAFAVYMRKLTLMKCVKKGTHISILALNLIIMVPLPLLVPMLVIFGLSVLNALCAFVIPITTVLLSILNYGYYLEHT